MRGSFRTGYLVQRYDWRASLYLLAAIHAALFFAHLAFGPETLEVSAGNSGESPALATGWRSYFIFKRHNKSPIRLQEIVAALSMAFVPSVALPIAVCTWLSHLAAATTPRLTDSLDSIVFAYGGVMTVSNENRS
jgi:hypothetical protein